MLQLSSALSVEKRALALRVAAILTLSAFATMTPVILTIRGTQFFDVAHEFVAYRIGDALSLMFGEGQFVRPVQGISNALLSKAIVETLYHFFGSRVVEREILQVYSVIFFAAAFIGVLFVVAYNWRILNWSERASVGMMAIAPWYIGGIPSQLMIAPEYWFGEYAFLTCSLAILLGLRRSPGSSVFRSVGIGSWVAVGLSTKITLIGIAPIFFVAMPNRSWRHILFASIGGLTTYVLLVAAYADFSIEQTFNMLAFQIGFFIHPNHSQTYSGVLAAFQQNIHIVFLALVALTLVVIELNVRRDWALCALFWLAVAFYLVAKRPHFTSVTSFSLLLFFLVAFFTARGYRPVAATAAVMVMIFLSREALPIGFRTDNTSALEEKFGAKGIIFMPDNNWNSAMPVQAFAYNGGLAFRPVFDGPNGPSYNGGAEALRSIFPDVVMVGASESELKLIAHGMRAGMAVSWTRPQKEDGAHPLLLAAIADAGAEITESLVYYHRRWWYFGKASRIKAASPN
jgi:hypothetical protein